MSDSIETQKTNKYGILILNYNSWENTLEMVDNCHFLFGVNYRDIIVVDNASINESDSRLQEASEQREFIYIQSGENKGYAFGNNFGLRYAHENDYKYIWILNNDIVLKSKKLLQDLINILEEDKSLATVNPDIVAGDGHLYNRDAVRHSFWDLTLGMLYYIRKGRRVKDMGGYSYIYRPQGCCMLVDVDKLHEIDYMDENTFLYCEEMILSERLTKKGYKCACYIKDKIVHHNSQTVKASFSKKKYIETYNKSFCYYLKEYRDFSNMKISICKAFNTLKLLVLR